MGGNITKFKAEAEENPAKIRPRQYEDLKIRDAEQEKKDKDQDQGKNDDEDEEHDSDHLSRMICPGSPSFRIYCQPQPQPQPQKYEGPVHHKSLSTGSFKSFPLGISANSIESLESIPKSKKGKFGSVKKLVKVKSCYYPRCACSVLVAQ